MIRVAILGAGIGAQHIAAYKALPNDWEVICVVDLDQQRAESLGVPGLTKISDALEDPRIDVIDICLPPKLHVPVALDALASGKHVICEKPIATSLADVDRLEAACAQVGKHVFPVFQYRFGPAFSQLLALKDAGLVGSPRAASLETHWSRGSEYYENPWRGSWAGEQGGAIVTHAIHAHDLLSEYFDPPTQVSARLATLANPIETDDSASLSFKTKHGALVTSSVCLGAARDETRLRFVYEHLTATSGSDPYAPALGPWSFTARDPQNQPSIDAIVARDTAEFTGFTAAFQQVARALNGAPNKAVTLEDGRRSVALITAIYAAARSGQEQSVQVPQSHPLYEGWQP